MENSHMYQYIKNQIKNGTPKDQILAFLVSKGWPLEIVESTFDSVNNEETKVSEPVNISQTPILKPKKSLKKRIITYLIIALTILLIITGGLFAYLNYFPSPEIVLARTFQNMSKVTSFQYSADFSVKGKVSNINEFSYNGISNMILEGGYDKKDINNQKSLLNLIVKTTPQGQSAMEAKLESRLKNKDLFVAITEGPEEIDTIKNQWVKIKLDESTEVKNFENNLKIATNEKKVSSEQQKKLDTQLMKIAKIAKVYADDKIDEIDMFHYQYEINPLEITNYYTLTREMSEEKSLTNEEKEGIKKEVKDVQPIIGEIWIGKKDFNLYRIKSYYDFSKNLDNYWTAGVDIKIKNYDQAIQFDAPDKAKTPEEIYDMYNLSTQTTLLKELNEEAKTLEVDTDKDGLDDIEEKYKYGTNPNNSDTDGDGYLDGDEVKNEYNPKGEGRLIESICGFSECPEAYNVN